jgi:hypothetical protein
MVVHAVGAAALMGVALGVTPKAPCSTMADRKHSMLGVFELAAARWLLMTDSPPQHMTPEEVAKDERDRPKTARDADSTHAVLGPNRGSESAAPTASQDRAAIATKRALP